MKKILTTIFLILIINPMGLEGRPAEPVRPENEKRDAHVFDEAWQAGYDAGKAVNELIDVQSNHGFKIPLGVHGAMLFYESFLPNGADWDARAFATATYGKPADITRADDGKTITLEVGTIVRIMYEYQPALNEWTFADSTNLAILCGLRQTTTNSLEYTPGSAGIGYAGNTVQKEHIRMALYPGVATLDLRLIDKSEGNENSVIDSIRVEIIVEEAE